MLKSILNILSSIFTIGFVGLLVFCGVILVFVYPRIVSTKYPVEYKVGKIIGYFYLIGGPITYVIITLFS